MNEAVRRMFERYEPRSVNESVRAMREILQEVALLGLWRAKFFEKAAFYGGTALRVLYGLDRFSEDLDFTLLSPNPRFDITSYMEILEREVRSYDFEVHASRREKASGSAIQSAFLKADTLKLILTIRSDQNLSGEIPRGQTIKIRFEVDTNPPPNFETETKFLLQPIPFSVRSVTLPDLFASKMHAVLCRRWKTRVKGRDWYDFVWYIANHPELHLDHLRERMIQSGDWKGKEPFTADVFKMLLTKTVKALDVHQARKEVEPFVRNPEALEVWSKEFFLSLVPKMILV